MVLNIRSKSNFEPGLRPLSDYEGVRFKSLYTIPKAVVSFHSINTILSIQPFINATTQSS